MRGLPEGGRWGMLEVKGGETMRPVRALGLALGAAAVVTLAAGAAYVVLLLRSWGAAVRATNPFEASEPI